MCKSYNLYYILNTGNTSTYIPYYYFISHLEFLVSLFVVPSNAMPMPQRSISDSANPPEYVLDIQLEKNAPNPDW